MWSALENIALRESLPIPLKAGESIHDILIAGQLDNGRHNLHHLGQRRSKQYLLKQFYSINSNAFLRWQNETRFINVPQTPGYTWPSEEWRGGVISPLPEGLFLDDWLEESPPGPHQRLAIAAQLASRIASLHAAGIAHRGLSPKTIRFNGAEINITDFGYARCDEWDDFWTDSILEPDDKSCASPEFLRGEGCCYTEDVHAFGAILHLLLSGRSAFSAMKQMLRPTFPNLISPDHLPKDTVFPQLVHELVSACLAPSPDERPLMADVATRLGEVAEVDTEITSIEIPQHTTAEGTEKVMVFINDDDRAVPLFDASLRHAAQTPSLFLFVGLIPHNLPSGHTERFQGTLLRKLGKGLLRSRAADLQWSLRVLDQTDPGRTAMELVDQYQPDRIFIGTSSKTESPRKGFPNYLKSESDKIELIY